MKTREWEESLLRPKDSDSVWELFHENSKTGRYDVRPRDEEVLAAMAMNWQSLPFIGYPVVELPTERTLTNISLDDAILGRLTARHLKPMPVGLTELATLLHYANGITRDNIGTRFPRPFRTIASAGALYPLELFFHTTVVEGLVPGLYHYNSSENVVRRVRTGDFCRQIAELLVQPEIATENSLIVFITAVFERTIFKYGDRGYRFVLLEAGHVAQNINLVSAGLGLGSVNLGGFFDRKVDAFLQVDGVTHSAVYLIAIGRNGDPSSMQVGGE